MAREQKKRRVRLICWKPELAAERAALLEQAGFEVEAAVEGWSRITADAVVIDLDRLPSHGREVGVALRRGKKTASIPLVFAGGAAAKISSIREEMPDAIYTEWSAIVEALRKARETPVAAPVRPKAHMERFAGTPLGQKLGVKAGMRLALLGAPDGFGEQFDNVVLDSAISTGTGLVLWFVRSVRELAEVEYIAAALPEGVSIWIVHPKQAGRIRVDFNQNDVRDAGLAVGIVDYKVCSVDEDWSGLKFARRLPKRSS